MDSFGASGIDLGTSGVDFCVFFGTKTPQPPPPHNPPTPQPRRRSRRSRRKVEVVEVVNRFWPGGMREAIK